MTLFYGGEPFISAACPQPDHELTLKFRSSDYQEAAAVDVRPLLPCVNVVKFKEEILPPRDGSLGMRSIYSHSCELDTPNTILTQSFETIAQVFPALQRTRAKQKTRATRWSTAWRSRKSWSITVKSISGGR